MGFSAVTSVSAWIPNVSCVFVDRNNGTTPSGRAGKYSQYCFQCDISPNSFNNANIVKVEA